MAKTLERLRRNFYWPNLAVDVKNFIAKCDVCHETKSPNVILKPPMKTFLKTERCFQKLFIDLLGPYPRSKSGKIGIIIVLDHLSKFTLLKPIRNFTANPIVEFLKEDVFPIYGVPEYIVSDNGKQFVSKNFTDLLKERGIHHIRTAIYSPQANASERVNRSIVQGIRAYLGKSHKDWDKFLPEIGEALRSSIHQSTKHTPYFSIFGQQMISHGKEYNLLRQLDSMDENILSKEDKLKIVRKKLNENIQKAFEMSAKRYNLRSRNVKLTVGDIVFRRNFISSEASKNICHKLAPKFIKAKVIGCKGNNLYRLEDVETKRQEWYHAKDIIQQNQ